MGFSADKVQGEEGEEETRDEMFVELQTHGVRPVLVKGKQLCETGVMSIVKL